MKYSKSKSEAKIGALWEAQTKTAQIDCFTKNQYPPMFFEINTSNFQGMFLNILKSFVRMNLKKINK